MKRVVAVMTACVIAAVLVVALLAIEDKPVKRDETVGESIKTVASVVDTDGTDVLLKSEEPEKHALLQQADYDQIKEEIADPEYRKSVKIAKKKYVVIRKENDKTGSIKDENWYKKSGARSYEVISRDDAGNGEEVVSYEISTGKKKDIWEVVDKLNQPEYDDEILITEPVYFYYTCDEGQPSEANNPGMANEWYLNDQDMDTIWGDPDTYGDATGEGTVVAVIDTGVDYTHEDLEDSMWMNTAELQGEDNVDDDNNGYKDDIYGVNFIDGSSNPQDTNGHGTHVSGIIAMSDNNTGGVGLAYKAKIMAVKAGDSDGSFASTDIAKALAYASNNGADVINMSFGGYAHSALEENALRLAFSTCVLVASAGNDGIPTKDGGGNNLYPASFQYVLGVMAVDKQKPNELADFSNWDFRPNFGAEYEIAAPGVEIYSTLPNNRYASWSGTSMAAPVVSAAAAILRSSHPEKEIYSSRYIMGQIASATDDKARLSENGPEFAKLNVADSIMKAPKPNIYVNEVYMCDSPDIDSANNGDGIVQPGEVIDLAIGLRNQWGAATDVHVTANATSDGGVDNPYVEFVTGQSVKIDDIGTFGTQDNGFVKNEDGTIVGVEKPIRVRILENAPNDANIQFNINYLAKNGMDDNDHLYYFQEHDTKFTLSVQKGTVLKGRIDRDTTLTKDNYYIVENSLLIPRGVTVNVEAGTKIQFWSNDQASVYGTESIADIQVQGVMNFNGTAAEPIELFPGKDFEAYRVEIRRTDNGIVNMDYVNIINPFIQITEGTHLDLKQDFDYILFRDFNNEGKVISYTGKALIGAGKISSSTVSNIRSYTQWDVPEVSGTFDTVQFDNCYINYSGIKAENCTFLINQGRSEGELDYYVSYHTSVMNNSGDIYTIPQIELASDIITYEGKKYAIYSMQDNPFGMDYSVYQSDPLTLMSYPSYKALLELFQINGGSVAYLTENGYSDRNHMFAELIQSIDGNTNSYVLTGAYYDRDNDVITSCDGSDVEQFWYNDVNLRRESPFSYMWYNTYLDGEGVNRTYVLPGCRNDLLRYIAVEFPDDTDDYKIRNLNMDIWQLDILKNTKFKNNAILNRLASKEPDDWMKLSASYYNNNYLFLAQNNYWGTTDEKLIQKQLIDFDTNIRFADYIVEPYLEAIPETAYPAVSDVYILDKEGEKVTDFGSGTYEVHILFNRDMDTSVQPFVAYGPDDPYTDYQVNGSFVNPREWVGTMTVRILINQGQQYFNIEGAVAADDPWLVTGRDWGRFTFNIEASGAEALILQSEGKRGSIDLTWTQDEYDTLAGYNVYRSMTGETGSFKKINSSIITSDTKEFSDKNVDAAKRYYYYFTVVDTDMKESRPSNIAIGSSIDNEPPEISHTKPKTITYGLNAAITAKITDNVGVNSAVLFYRMQGDSAYTPVYMTCTNEDTYSAQIQAASLREGTLEYYIEAYDSETTGFGASEDEPFTVPVECNAVITSVSGGTGEVGSVIEASIKGINFTEDMKVRVDGKTVESTFVSSEQIDISYEPVFMGKKKVEITRNSLVIASLSKAITVSDPSIKLFNVDDTVIVGSNDTQKICMYSNFEGTLESVEISFYDPQNKVNFYHNYGGLTESATDTDGVKTQTITWKNLQFNSGIFGYFNLYGLEENYLPEIRSLKINGVDVESFDINEDKVKFIDIDDYIPVESISAEQDYYTINIGETITPVYTVVPSNATDTSVTITHWDGLKLNDDGSLTAVHSGQQNIVLTARGNITTTITVNVRPIPITEIIPKQSEITGMVGEIKELSADAYPLESDSRLTWSKDYGDDVLQFEELADSRNIKVRLTKAGTGTYRVSYEGDHTIYASVTITVRENTSYVDIQDEIITLKPNETHMLSAEIRNGSDDQNISWSTSNSAVAYVENGRLIARGTGLAVITAALASGKGSDSVIVLVGTDSMEYLLGDVSLDGVITSADAMLTLKLAVSGNYNDVFAKIADVNNDSIVTSSDALMILQYVTGKIDYFES